VNDGSPDNTADISLRWCHKDKRIKYIEKQNGGLSSARNAGIEYAKGTYILPLDADDKIGNKYLELALIEFQKHPWIKIVYCEAEFFGIRTGKWDMPPYLFKSLLLSNLIFCSAVFMKEDWQRCGGYDVKMDAGLEDWEFWINMRKKENEVKKLDSIQFYYRIKTISRTTQLDYIKNKRLMDYVCKKHYDVYSATFGNCIELCRKYTTILHSNSYRIGRIITAPVRKIKDIMQMVLV
jgi:glycosyltransferase involved in cell wall biosynthesis